MPSDNSRQPTQDQLLEWMQTLSNWGRWGSDDQKGTLNNLSAEKTKRALGLVQEGVTVSCARDITWTPAPDIIRQPQHFQPIVAGGEVSRLFVRWRGSRYE